MNISNTLSFQLNVATIGSNALRKTYGTQYKIGTASQLLCTYVELGAAFQN